MSKEKLTMDEAYTCPRCGGQAVNVGAMEQIFSDARSEKISCMKCGSSWMVYYKMHDFNTKTLNITDTPLEDESTAENVVVSDDGALVDALSTSIDDDKSILCTADDSHVVADDGTNPGIIPETVEE